MTTYQLVCIRDFSTQATDRRPSEYFRAGQAAYVRRKADVQAMVKTGNWKLGTVVSYTSDRKAVQS